MQGMLLYGSYCIVFHCVRLGFDVLFFLCCVVWYCVPLYFVVVKSAELYGIMAFCPALYTV